MYERGLTFNRTFHSIHPGQDPYGFNILTAYFKLLVVFYRALVIVYRTINEFLRRNGPQLAAAISYYTLFSIFPLVIAVTSGLSFILEPNSIEELARRAAQQSPVSKETVNDIFSSAVSSRGIAGVAGILGLLWAGTAVFGAIRKGINATWAITRPRPFLQERLIDITFMLLASILMLISIFSTAALTYLMEIIEFITPETYVDGTLIWDKFASAIPPVLSFIVFFTVYWLLPNTKVKITEPLPGAIVATTAFELLKNVFVWYIGSYSIYSTIYGSVGSIVALLTWVYVSALILLFGSLITARISEANLIRETELADTVGYEKYTIPQEK